MLNGLDLFSGIGGISLALRDYVRPVAYCEIDPYCQGVLLSRMASGDLDNAPIWDDVKTLNGKNLQEIDIIFGGFPCQDISVAGLGKGLAGERSGLFFEIIRLAKEIKPTWLFLENVRAITSRGGAQVISEIAQMGYDTRWCCISASKYIDQNRERWFCLAKLNSERWEKRTSERIQPFGKTGIDEELGNYKLSSMESWTAFANSVRKNHGVSFRMDRIKSLGNSACPQQTKEAFEILMGLK